MAINDTSIVRVLDGDTGSELWRGTLADFERDNQFDDAEAAAFRTELHRDGLWIVGGGAAGKFVVEIVSAGWIVTAIASKGARVSKFPNPFAATLGMASAITGQGAAVLLIGPDGEYRSVINPTAPERSRIAAIGGAR